MLLDFAMSECPCTSRTLLCASIQIDLCRYLICLRRGTFDVIGLHATMPLTGSDHNRHTKVVTVKSMTLSIFKYSSYCVLIFLVVVVVLLRKIFILNSIHSGILSAHLM